MASSDTPKYWKQYLAYIAEHNKAWEDSITNMQKEDQAEYDALPWYKKMFRTSPDNDYFNLSYFWNAKEPNILDYYNWDVNIRGKK